MRFLLAQFCDDIRQEINGKYSLIGCYTDDIIVDKFPTVLPKLCAQIRAVTPLGKPFLKLSIKVLLDEELIAEMVVPEQQLAESHDALLTRSPVALRHTAMAMMQFIPMVLAKPSRLRVEADTEEGTLPGSFLIVRERERTADAGVRLPEALVGAPDLLRGPKKGG